MSSTRNPLAVRPTNAFGSRKQDHTAVGSQARTRRLPEGENEDPRGDARDKRNPASKSGSGSGLATQNRNDAQRTADDIVVLKEQFLKDMQQEYSIFIAGLRVVHRAACRKVDKVRLGNIGRIICRTLCPFDDLSEPLHWALKRRNGVRLDADQKTAAALGDQILNAFEDLQALIVKYGLCYAETQITQARNNVRGTDTLKIRRGIMQWHDWDIPPESANDKSKRGWAHKEMAQLIFPDHIEFSTGGAQMYLDGKLTVSEQDIPCLVYADNVGEDVSGFLLGDYLLRGGEGLLHGAQAPVTGRRASSNTAKKHHITSVNEVFIQYVICLVRYALSNEDEFSPDGAQGFNYIDLFNTMGSEIAAFKAAGTNGAGEAAMDHVIETWNKFIFKRRKPTIHEVNPKSEQDKAEYREDRRRVWALYAEGYQRKREAQDAEEDGEKQSSPQPASAAGRDAVPLFLSERDIPQDEDVYEGQEEVQDEEQDSDAQASNTGNGRGSASRRGRGAASRVVRSPSARITPSPSSPKRSHEVESPPARNKRGKHRK